MTRIAVALALAAALAAPAAAQDTGGGVPENVQATQEAVQVMSPGAGPMEQGVEAAAAGVEHGAEAGHDEGGIDFLHHILDGRYIEVPGGKIDLPAAHTWQAGPFDFTPTKHVVFLGIAALLTLAVLLYAGAASGRAQHGRTTGRRHNAIEAMVLFIRNEVVMPNIGHGGDRFAPFIITLFFFILFCNLLGLLPFGSTATANISVTAGLALISLVVVEVSGMVALGPKGYLKTVWVMPHGMNPVAGFLVALLLFPVEVMGKLAKPFSLAVRLMANMTAGHIVLLALISLIFIFGLGLAFAPVLMATAIFFLEIFVAFLQAFIFAMLTSVFIGLIQHAH